MVDEFKPPAMRPADVAKRLAVSLRTVYALLETRQLGFIKVGGQYRIRQADIEAFEERNWHPPIAEAPPPPAPRIVVRGESAYDIGRRVAAKLRTRGGQ